MEPEGSKETQIPNIFGGEGGYREGDNVCRFNSMEKANEAGLRIERKL